MKKIFIIACIGAILSSNAQEKQKLEDLFNVQVGLIGTWVSYEKTLGDKLTLNTELGYAGGFFKGTNNHSVDYIFTTIFSVEPRYYYNFDRRVKKAKNVTNNAANYFTIELYFVPDWLTETNRLRASVESNFGIIPKWGFRRNLVQNLNFDFAIGMGYSSSKYRNRNIQTALDVRLSYSF